ncbi:GTP-binding protein [Nocardiopsis sp. CT-R113]|uniref:GTP-binding protein n=1 Tax=Nocardiopsis codii TaxID=3065942 RepID=A0ABU7K598_9ACTN|nr:GTP-binding protein [Nocardiopsis sp. CT-R113]MEE2037421.1 GTP-binding protein [Nocardiopsis sp. CT-R113]
MRVVLISGLHRSARRTTSDDLLAASPGSVVVHHDLGEIGEGTVHRVTRDGSGRADRREVHLVHACASCTLREDLLPLLVRMAEEGLHDLCVVEAWDGVEPRLIAESVAAEPSLTLACVVTAVDSDLLLDDLTSADELGDRGLDIARDDERTVTEVLVRQIEYPSVVVLHGSSERAEARALLEQLNPGAVVVPPGAHLEEFAHGLFDPGSAHARLNPVWAQYGDRADGRVRTVTWTRTRPLHPQRLADALETVVSMGLRGRGRFWLASRPDSLLVWDSHNELLMVENGGPWMDALPGAALDLVSEARRASALLDWEPDIGDRRQHLAFTGIDLDGDALVEILDSCLVTDEETLQDHTTDPFAEFSER